MDETRQLARFVVESTFDTLPADTIALTKERLLDILGESLFATRGVWCRIVHDMVVERTGRQDSTLWGSSRKADPAGAALVNGTLGHGFELDAYLAGSSHPGAVVIPAALAVGEQVGSSGRDLMAAMVPGYEVMGRVTAALGTAHVLRGFHPTAMGGVFGSTTVAGKLCGG